MSGRRLPLTNGQLTVRGDQRALVVTGPIRAGGSNVQIAWTERLNQPAGRASSSYQISGDFDARDLVRLGYTVDVVDVVERYLYRPLIPLGRHIVHAAQRLQSGRLDAYMAYMLIALLAVLAVVTGIALN